MSKDDDKSKDRQERFWRQLTALLTVIGLWIALPSTCGLFQGIVDNFTQLRNFSETTVIITKVITDSCLLMIYILGLLAVIFFGMTAIAATKTKEFAEDIPAMAQKTVTGTQTLVEKTSKLANRVKDRFSQKESSEGETSEETNKN